MLLCGSANRAKSWSCENCKNWKLKEIKTCSTCYWAYPEKYKHIAMRDIRRLDIVWVEEETAEYDQLMIEAGKVRQEPPDYVKTVLRNHFNEKRSFKK